MNAIPDKLPETIYTTADVRELDRHAIEDHGIPGLELMERAGRAAVDSAKRRWPEARQFAVYCGAGNNAGDGYVFARLAEADGLSVRVEAVGASERLAGAALRAYEQCRDAGVAIEVFQPEAELLPDTADVVVDALLGTGLTREVEGRFALAIQRINAVDRPVLALDIPSGLDGDQGHPMGAAVRATATISFVGLKQGLFLGVAPDYVGELEFDALDLPDEVFATAMPSLRRLSPTTLQSVLPARSRMGHKGSHGRLLIVGGGPGMAGAVRLAGEAALRVGAGLVYVATDCNSIGTVMTGRPELMARAIERTEDLDPLLELADAVVLGPGLGRSDWASSLWQCVLASDRPLILDADGLNLLAAVSSESEVDQATEQAGQQAGEQATQQAVEPRTTKQVGGQRVRRGNWLLTPHPGEAGRLLGTGAAAIQRDRLGSVKALAERYQAVVALKGACTLVAEPGGGGKQGDQVHVCDYGNPGMGTGGTGDVLAGVLGGLAVQLGSLSTSAKTGVLLHALAGDRAAEDGERGLVAGDLLPALRYWANPC